MVVYTTAEEIILNRFNGLRLKNLVVKSAKQAGLRVARQSAGLSIRSVDRVL